MIDTYWGGLGLEEIDRIEKRLRDRNFRSQPGLSAWTLGGFLGWFVEKTLYSSGKESVTLYRIKRAIFGRPIGNYRWGDVKIRVEQKNYEEILLGRST